MKLAPMQARSVVVFAASLVLLSGWATFYGEPRDEANPAANPTPYQGVLFLIDRAAKFPMAGDDLTLYISGRFARLVAPEP